MEEEAQGQAVEELGVPTVGAIQSYIQQAKLLGVEGDKIAAWVTQQQDKERERNERAIQRQHEKDMAEIQLKSKQIEAGARSKEAETSNSQRDRFTTNRLLNLHLPKFDVNNDLIDAFIDRFELTATAAGLAKEQWAIHLNGLLAGKALEVLQSLNLEEVADYDTLKQRLLKHFSYTPLGLKSRIKELVPEKGEDFARFVNQLRQNTKKWLELSEVAPTYEGLLEFMLMDSIYEKCHNDLIVHFRLGSPKTVEELAKMGEDYRTAYPDRFLGSSKETDDA